MNIQLTFDDWDELCTFLTTAKAQPELPEDAGDLAKLAKEAKKAAEKTDVFKEAKKAAKALAEEPKEEPDSVPFDTAETAAEPEYTLTDAQKAVRECVKAKGNAYINIRIYVSIDNRRCNGAGVPYYLHNSNRLLFRHTV